MRNFIFVSIQLNSHLENLSEFSSVSHYFSIVSLFFSSKTQEIKPYVSTISAHQVSSDWRRFEGALTFCVCRSMQKTSGAERKEVMELVKLARPMIQGVNPKKMAWQGLVKWLVMFFA